MNILVQFDTKKLSVCLNELVKSLLDCTTLQKITEITVESIKEHLFFDIVAFYLFTQEQKLQLRANFGLDLSIEDEPNDLTDEFILENFTKKGVYVFYNWPEKKEHNQLFPKLKDILTIAVVPLIYKNTLLGFLSIGFRSEKKFIHDELLFFETLGLYLGELIGNFLINSNYQKHITELSSVLKYVRHDFANDIQSIALALELLQSTELNEEQQKYVRILNKAKDSSINRIKELKQLKQKHEEEVTVGIGIIIKKQQKN